MKLKLNFLINNFQFKKKLWVANHPPLKSQYKLKAILFKELLLKLYLLKWRVFRFLIAHLTWYMIRMKNTKKLTSLVLSVSILKSSQIRAVPIFLCFLILLKQQNIWVKLELVTISLYYVMIDKMANGQLEQHLLF